MITVSQCCSFDKVVVPACKQMSHETQYADLHSSADKNERRDELQHTRTTDAELQDNATLVEMIQTKILMTVAAILQDELSFIAYCHFVQ